MSSFQDPKFVAKTFAHDIALLLLSENANVEPLSVVGGNLDDLVGQPDCFITGYGSAAGKEHKMEVVTHHRDNAAGASCESLMESVM